MNHEISPNKHELADAYQVLNSSMHDEKLLALVGKTGPLQLSELDGELRQSEAFQAFVADMGWPSVYEDGAVTPPPHFKDDHQFLEALTEGVEVEGRNLYLNNYKMLLSVQPSSDAFTSIPLTYAAKPALHRAYAVAPEFMSALHTAYTSLPKEYYLPSTESLASGEGELVVKSAHVAYQLLARLLKRTDPEIEMMTLFNTHTDNRIADAATALAQ